MKHNVLYGGSGGLTEPLYCGARLVITILGVVPLRSPSFVISPRRRRRTPVCPVDLSTKRGDSYPSMSRRSGTYLDLQRSSLAVDINEPRFPAVVA